MQPELLKLMFDPRKFHCMVKSAYPRDVDMSPAESYAEIPAGIATEVSTVVPKGFVGVTTEYNSQVSVPWVFNAKDLLDEVPLTSMQHLPPEVNNVMFTWWVASYNSRIEIENTSTLFDVKASLQAYGSWFWRKLWESLHEKLKQVSDQALKEIS